jgi:hypothetical protein
MIGCIELGLLLFVLVCSLQCLYVWNRFSGEKSPDQRSKRVNPATSPCVLYNSGPCNRNLSLNNIRRRSEVLTKTSFSSS